MQPTIDRAVQPELVAQLQTLEKIEDPFFIQTSQTKDSMSLIAHLQNLNICNSALNTPVNKDDPKIAPIISGEYCNIILSETTNLPVAILYDTGADITVISIPTLKKILQAAPGFVTEIHQAPADPARVDLGGDGAHARASWHLRFRAVRGYGRRDVLHALRRP